jgi:hypothetical protein
VRTFAVASVFVLVCALLVAGCGGEDELKIEAPPDQLVLQQAQLPSELYEQTKNEASGDNGHTVEYEAPTGLTVKSTVVLLEDEAGAVDYARRQGEQYIAQGYEQGPEDEIGDFTLTYSRIEQPAGTPAEGTPEATSSAFGTPTATPTGPAEGSISHVVIAVRGRAASTIEVNGANATLGAARILADLVMTNIDKDYPTPVVS